MAGSTQHTSDARPPEEGAHDLADDYEAVERAKAGDRAAFGRLYRAWGSTVHGILLCRVSDHEAADLVQDVFETAMRRLGELREAHRFGGWLATIARNRAIDHRRKRKPVVSLQAEPVTNPHPARAEAIAVLRVIRTLPDAYKETLVLRLVEGMTGPEIALKTGLTAGSVRVNLHRGMKMLRAKLAGRSDDV